VLFDSLVIGRTRRLLRSHSRFALSILLPVQEVTLTFEAMPDGADNTAFFDVVSIQAVPNRPSAF